MEEPPDSSPTCGGQQAQRARGVDLVTLRGIAERAPHAEAGKVKHLTHAAECGAKSPLVSHVAHFEFAAPAAIAAVRTKEIAEVLLPTRCQIVENPHLSTLAHKLHHQLGADEAGASGDEGQGAIREPWCGAHERAPSRRERAARIRRTRAGTPATTAKAGTSRVTTAPAPTIAPRPIVTPGRTTAPVPMSDPDSMRTGSASWSVSMTGRSEGSPLCRAPRIRTPGPTPTQSPIIKSRASRNACAPIQTRSPRTHRPSWRP